MSLDLACFEQNMLGLVSRKVGRNRRQIFVRLRALVILFSCLSHKIRKYAFL